MRSIAVRLRAQFSRTRPNPRVQLDHSLASVHRWTRIALASVFLLGVLPGLVPIHTLPLPSFYEEWLAGTIALIVCTATLGAARQGIVGLTAPQLWLLAFAAVVGLQGLLGQLAYFQQALHAIVYVLLAIGMYWCGRQLRDGVGAECLARTIAIGLLAGGSANAIIGLVQAYAPAAAIDGLIVPLVNPRVFGNLGQPNLFADQLALAGVSLLYLWTTNTLRGCIAIAFGALLLIGLALSGSRSAWLFAVWLLTWSVLHRFRSGDARFGGVSVSIAVGLALLAVLPWLLPPIELSGVRASPTSALERLAGLRDGLGEGALDRLRLQFWGHAWDVLGHAPLLGAGMGEFAFSFLTLDSTSGPTPWPRIERNAHNLALHLLAETGIAGALCVAAALAFWLARVLRTSADPVRWWTVGTVGVVLVHSTLEYPLWYAHFLAPVALIMGLGDRTRSALVRRSPARIAVAAALTVGAAAHMTLLVGYTEMRQWVYQVPDARAQDASVAARQLETIRRLLPTLLGPYVELPLAVLQPVDRESLDEKLAVNGRVMRFAPIPPIVLRQVVFLALAERDDEARRLLDAAIRYFPKELDAFSVDLDRLHARGLRVAPIATYLSAARGKN